MNIENTKAQMRRGVLELCILAIIAEREAYPSDIIQKLKESELIVVEGTLYPLLTRLKNDGLLDYHWQESNSGPPRKYFRITAEGVNFLQGLIESWNEMVRSVAVATHKFGKPVENY
jgi:PadR family transcriptional regulator, regulatory protein PadR